MSPFRLQATKLIESLILGQGSLSSLLPPALTQVREEERPLLQQLCYGTLREFFRLEAIALHLLREPPRERDADVLALILIGLYQLREMRTATHAAVDETVKTARLLNKPWAKGLINALLRRYLREEDQLIAELHAESSTFRYNHPDWMLDKLRHNWPEHWQQLVWENDQRAPMTLRVNSRLTSRAAMLTKLQEAGIQAHLGAHSPTSIYLQTPCDVTQLPGFARGEISVQDEAAQLSAELLQLAPGQRVLDACAAPGGKLCHLLEKEENLAEVIALELNPKRAARINENLERLGLSDACHLILTDATQTDWWDGRPFDRILIDAPCSGSGVIRRNPDIKLLRLSEDLLALAKIQLSLLEALWPLLAPGGLLVYATCSIFPQENERVIERFCRQHADAEIDPIPLSLGVDRQGMRQIFPALDGPDGFFYARLRKGSPAEGEQTG
ncbi:16S rRNA (cytosine(967)-C(5))-methyltransferase RsmB [Nitrincola tapanii]|uniref:16S rRNA (cytosine(967)-C(5))-methyltransferase n=1 Tax=Nitrincola tapanii TaxID=1708751 RepID=A0A5A9W0Y3_9GAMM|nr:16S rRNA (cytosine(967)-C(5))-methyltransferase RsmB [Nitrincola tapanii]KAA0873778.1 16S rRNA (cytosine(967)-C(5))-methyltransferase RsmB [Nitrincola tapanii]